MFICVTWYKITIGQNCFAYTYSIYPIIFISNHLSRMQVPITTFGNENISFSVHKSDGTDLRELDYLSEDLKLNIEDDNRNIITQFE